MLIKLRCDRQNLIQLLGETSAAILDAVLALEFALTLGSVARSSTTSANGRLPNSIRNLIAFPSVTAEAVVHLLSRAKHWEFFHRGRTQVKSLSHVCVKQRVRDDIHDVCSLLNFLNRVWMQVGFAKVLVFVCGNFSLCLNSFYRRSDAGKLLRRFLFFICFISFYSKPT